jgi:hypothetical protein
MSDCTSKLSFVLGTEELESDSDAPRAASRAGPAHAADQEVVDPQLPANLSHRHVGAGVSLGGPGRYQAKATHRAQAARDFIRHAGRKVLVGGGTEILEWENCDDCRPLGIPNQRPGRPLSLAAAADPQKPDGPHQDHREDAHQQKDGSWDAWSSVIPPALTTGSSRGRIRRRGRRTACRCGRGELGCAAEAVRRCSRQRSPDGLLQGG